MKITTSGNVREVKPPDIIGSTYRTDANSVLLIWNTVSKMRNSAIWP